MIEVSAFAATPLDVPVAWAVLTENEPYWRDNSMDHFLRWDGGLWCLPTRQRTPSTHPGIPAHFGGIVLEPLPAGTPIVEHRGKLLGFSADGYALVMDAARALVVMPVVALRAEPPP